jgi:pyruvate, water dikinase
MNDRSVSSVAESITPIPLYTAVCTTPLAHEHGMGRIPAKHLNGIGASSGIATGPTRPLKCIEDLRDIRRGDIIVTSDATAYLVPGLAIAAGAICERGGLTCHLAVLARELDVPCVVGVREAVGVLQGGLRVFLDGTSGEITILDESG